VSRRFPASGCTFGEVQGRIEELAGKDLDPARQRMFALMQQGDDEVHRVSQRAYNLGLAHPLPEIAAIAEWTIDGLDTTGKLRPMPKGGESLKNTAGAVMESQQTR
jgi:hypothetical protein